MGNQLHIAKLSNHALACNHSALKDSKRNDHFFHTDTAVLEGVSEIIDVVIVIVRVGKKLSSFAKM